MRLLTNCIVEPTIAHYIAHSHKDQQGIWGSTTEILVLVHLLGINIASHNSVDMAYQVLSPGSLNYSRPTIYIVLTGSMWSNNRNRELCVVILEYIIMSIQ